MISSDQHISSISVNPSSFRDPSGFIFTLEKEIFRAIAPSYLENFSLFEKSGLYKSLSEKKLIVQHTEFENILPQEYSSYKIIKPDQIPFISYPYEWCFSQLKDAALLTLRIQKEALKHGMSLKDASAYNVQFIASNPIFIDTLSFEKYEEGKPWVAYGQFCRHFLAPLALMAHRSSELSKLFLQFIDGIPLDLANALLPRRSLASSVVFSHLHVHSKFQKSSSVKKGATVNLSLSKKKLLSIIEHLESGIEGFSLKQKRSAWNNYDETHNYSAHGKEIKAKIISGWLKKLNPGSVFDMGSNTGEFSVLASQFSKQVIAMDSDHSCIESLYKSSSKNGSPILPLVIDITNPSPAIGWNNRERQTIVQRGNADVVMALALIHHLRIGNNTPFSHMADFFSSCGNNLIVEFIPKEDSQIKRMLENREDIFPDMNIEAFTRSFEPIFELKEKLPVPDSTRTMCLFKKKLL